MKHFVLAAAAVTVLATPIFAGGPVAVAAEPEPASAPMPVAAYDWSGPYVGLAYGKTSGTLKYAGFADIDIESGSTPSIFAGYLFQRGNLVYGGELAYTRGNDVSPAGYPAEHLEEMIDLKAKVGFAANRVLVYGSVGYSKVGYYWSTNGSWSTSGVAYGAGVDFAVTDRVTLGLEYLSRRTDDDVSTIPGLTTRDIDSNTLSLRVSFSF